MNHAHSTIYTKSNCDRLRKIIFQEKKKKIFSSLFLFFIFSLFFFILFSLFLIFITIFHFDYINTK